MRRLGYVTSALLLVALGALASPAQAATPKCNGKNATIVGTGSPITGTAGDDVIVGTDADETINGLAGNDTICGRGGADTISGGENDDTIFGEDGNDPLLTGNNGNDTVNGGDGNDVLSDLLTETGDDTYSGEAGNDLIVDLTGANVAHGGPGADEIAVTGRAYGDAGDDPAVGAADPPGVGGPADGYADGGSGDDGHAPTVLSTSPLPPGVRVAGGRADGNSGNDVVYGTLDGDEALGGSGSDFVDGSAGTAQYMDCGAAYDFYNTAGTDTIRRCEATGPNPNTTS
jgi:Ca2+-binding RTX toxin-like protein